MWSIVESIIYNKKLLNSHIELLTEKNGEVLVKFWSVTNEGEIVCKTRNNELELQPQNKQLL